MDGRSIGGPSLIQIKRVRFRYLLLKVSTLLRLTFLSSFQSLF